MKILRAILAVLAVSAILLRADQNSTGHTGAANPASDSSVPPPTAFQINERGADHRVWQRDTFVKMPDGHIVPQHHAYTELSTGLYYKNAKGEWAESKELIEAFPGGAIARQGPYQVIFANDLNSYGAIDQKIPDGQRLRSHILGLMYHDTASGQALMIAQVQDSQGQIISANQVLYTNAFSGGVSADVRYTYKRGSFEQDVILRSQPPAPESVGMDPDTTELDIVTEFVDSPRERLLERKLRSPRTRQASMDQSIDWGTARIVRGQAFELGQDALFNGTQTHKEYLNLQGRRVLLEKVPVPDIQAGLSKLPRQASVNRPKAAIAYARLDWPKQPPLRVAAEPMKLAAASPAHPGFVLDYFMLEDIVTNDFTFRSDNTYLVSSGVTLLGKTYFEGGTVIKYLDEYSGIQTYGPVATKSSAYAPVVMTAKNDDSVGESVSDGGPIVYYNGALNPDPDGGVNVMELDHLRVSYCDVGIHPYSSGRFTIQDSQFIHCYRPICPEFSYVELNNVLVSDCQNLFWGGEYSVNASHVTLDGCQLLTDGWSDPGDNSITFTNSLLVNVVDGGAVAVSTNYTVTLASSSGVFQVAGAGSYYLATNSPYRNVGTTNIDPDFLAEIATKTTYPPMIFSNTPIAGGTYSPVVQRDTDTPDLGYHYDPLDYCLGRADATDNIVFTAGTAVGWFDLHATDDEPYNSYGLGLSDAMSVTYAGTQAAQCVQAKYSTVQEGNGNWADVSPWSFEGIMGGVGTIGSSNYDPSVAATINARFTLFAGHANTASVGNDYSSDLICRFTDCVLNAGRASSYNMSLYFTNCLCQGAYLYSICFGEVSACIILQNCTMREGQLNADREGNSWPIKLQNSAFESVDFSYLVGKSDMTDTNLSYCDYNAWITNQSRFPLSGIHELTVTNFNWQSSWLGNYYLPPNSPLINAGNTNADRWSLFHLTTQTNQIKETNSIVDIGYHSVAADAYGQPLDFNGDGISDYLEDANGNGITDGGEISWTNMDLDGDGLPNAWELAHGLNPFSAADVLQDPDYDGRNNLEEYQEGTDPQSSSDFSRVRLGLWRFDGTNTWAGDAGQMPLQATNIVGVTSWNTNAALIDGVTNSILKYRDVETNGSANINLRNGTLRFWFKPDWKSASLGGAGPGVFGRLLELGKYNPAYTNGWWSLYLTPDGNRMVFGSSTNGAGGTNVSAAVALTTNQWYQMVLTYTPTNSLLYLNGQVLTNGLAPTHYPSLAERTNGFTVGSDRTGTNQARGQFDELETFNYSLTASDINSNYLAALQKDKNGNGMADIWEWSNFGYVGVDPAGDPDEDGISNLEEYQDGTDPHLFATNRLGYWRFNDVPDWRDERGLSPSATIGLYPVSSWSGDAVKLSAAQNSVLTYPFNRTNHSVIVNFPTGSIRFWFKPDWGSAIGSQGQGPGDTIRLLEMGRQTGNTNYGWFGLTVNTLGTQLTLGSETNGLHVDNVSGPITFTPKGWYQIAVTYTATNSILYVNGSLIGTNAIGMTNLPSLAVLQEGLHVGCSWDGAHQANGAIDELETFNYVLSPANVAAAYAATNAIDSDGDGLSDILENSLGTNPNSVDSDCDGLPDAWEVAHGLNPNDPTDATAAVIGAYVQGSSVGSTNSVTVVETNLINVYFSKFTNNAYGTPVGGAVVSGGVSNGVWNFCNMHSDYTNVGVPLAGADGNGTAAKLYAFIGPCPNPIIIPPSHDEWDQTGPTIENSDGNDFPTSLTYTNFYTTNVTTTFSLTGYYHITTIYNPYLWGDWSAGGGVGAMDEYSWLLRPFASYYNSCYYPSGLFDPQFPIYYSYLNSVFDYVWGYYGDFYVTETVYDPIYLPWFGGQIWPRWTSTRYGFINITSTSVQTEVSNAVVQVNGYTTPLQGYLDGHPGLTPPTNSSPVEFVNSFISPFLAIDNRDYSLAARQGAIWNYPGGTNSVTESDLELTGGTNLSSGTVLKKMYPN
ncbi:MAG TPA: LamG-like jellyroll fold domain-containing protein, partial [Verrucomicrobiae bacterium]|nr:LamG-like jellyroll fold domain-containing protein [Verrucomicrobiae bacterium]